MTWAVLRHDRDINIIDILIIRKINVLQERRAAAGAIVRRGGGFGCEGAMLDKGKTFSIIRLNGSPEGWGVVDDASGALVHIDGLALRLTKQRALEIAENLNAEARDRGSASGTDV